MIEDDADEQACEPGFFFTLLSRSSEPVEIYDIEFSHMSVRRSQSPYSGLNSSVSLPFILKPYDYQHFHISVSEGFEKSHVLNIWKHRKSSPPMSLGYPLSKSSDIEVRTSRGVVKANVHGFSNLDNRKRRLAFKLLFARKEWQRKTYLKIPKLRSFLEGKNWWE